MQTAQVREHRTVEVTSESAVNPEVVLRPGDRIKVMAGNGEERSVDSVVGEAIGEAIETALSEADGNDAVAVEHAGYVFGAALSRAIQRAPGLQRLSTAAEFMKGFDRAWIVVR